VKIKVVFRVDAASYMGIGHVMRCLTLANALKQNGADIHFVCREHPGHYEKRIQSEGHKLHLLSPGAQMVQFKPEQAHTPPYVSWLGETWETDLFQTQTALKGEQFDWLIVDHYALDERWERGMRKLAKKIMVIDDLADRMHDCDMLLDQSFGRKDEAYKPWVGQQCTVLTGSKYALLRPEFSALRDYSLKRRADNKLEHLLITMGGVDQPNATGQVLEALQYSSLPQNCRITVVMGAEAPWLDAVREQAKKLDWPTDIKVNVSNMAQLMADSDLAIGAAGTTSWEICTLGLPAIVIATVDNQKFTGESLAIAGASWYLGQLDKLTENQISTVISHAASDPYALTALQANAKKIADGKGAERITRAMLAPIVEVREAVIGDGEMLFSWRNNPIVRKYFFDASEINIEEHLCWLEKSIASKDRLLLVATLDGDPIGSVRFDLIEDIAEISIYLNPDSMGQSLGVNILDSAIAWINRTHVEIRKIQAKVLKDNIASQRVFDEAGFDLKHYTFCRMLRLG